MNKLAESIFDFIVGRKKELPKKAVKKSNKKDVWGANPDVQRAFRKIRNRDDSSF